MANDKKFVVKKGLATPNVDFANGGGSISATFLSTSNTLSFSGNTGQLFSITDSMSGTIFSVNDISGIPSIEVIDTGSVKIAETFGTVAIGANTIANHKFYVNGNTLFTNATFSNSATINNKGRLNFRTLNGNTVFMEQQDDDNFVLYTTTPTGAARPVFSVYANTNTSNLSVVIPLQLSSTIVANNFVGTAGQVLTSSGGGVYWGAAGSGGFTGNTVSANSTIVKNQSYYVNAAAGWVTMTLPSTVATGDIFIVHSQTGNTRILNNSINIMEVGAGNDLVLESGQTVWVQAVNSSAVGVMFTYPAGGTPAVVANSTFATNANNALFANSASFVYGKQESQLSVAASNTALYLQNRTWETAGAIGATVANTGAFTTVSTTGDIQQQNANYLRGRNSSGTSTRLFGVNNANTVYVGGIDLPLGATLFVNNGVEHMRIESSGNVSIGSTATPTKLFVNGHMSVANGFGIYANGTLGANGLILTSNGTSLFWGSVSAAANATFSTTANNALFANSASFVYGKQESQLSVAIAANATFATTANNSLFSNSASFVYGKQESQLSVAIAANSGFAATANNSLFSNSASFAYGKQESQLSVALAANATFATTANNSLFSNSASFVYGKQESQLSVANSAALQGATWQAPLGIGTVTANTGAFTSLTASANVNLDSGTLFVDATNNRVGIGNTNPSFAFQVDGDALFASETIGLRTRFISGKSSPTSAAGPLYLQFNSSNPVHVGGGTGSADFYVPNGNVAIGATAAPTKLFVNGHMSVANGFGIYANGVLGTAGFVLTSNGSSLYWANASSISGTVTSANNSTFAYGKQESQLSVANAVFATTANNSLFSNSASFVYGKQESQLSVANAVYAQSSNSANFANAAAWLGGFQSSYYTNATNITTGTLAEARLPFRMNQNVRTTDDVTFANGTFTGTVSINGSLILTGNLVSTNIQSLSVIDPIIKLAANNSADTLWTGFVSHYEGSGNTTNHTGLLRNPSSKEYLLISTYGDELSVNNNIILTNDTSLTYANLAVRTLRLGNTSSTGYLDANSYSGNANNSTFSYGKQESQLSVANAVYATTAGSVLAGNVSGTVANANNASFLNGRIWETAGAIGSTVANTGAFTTLTASANVNIDSGTLFVDGTSNRVGVNITTPLHAHHVSGSVLAAGDASSVAYYMNDSQAIRSSGTMYIDADTSGQNGFTRAGTGDLIFRTAAAQERMRIISGGNIGIANTTPGQRLQVDGSVGIKNGLVANGTFGTSGQVLTSNGTVIYWANTSAGGFTGNTVSANATIVKNQSYYVNAAAGWVNMTMPSAVVAGDIFIVHSETGNTRILNNSINIMNVGSGNDLLLESGQTVWVQAVNTSSVGIMFTYPAGGTPAVVANSSFATSSNNSLYLDGRTWATPFAIGSTAANTGAFTTISAKPNQTGSLAGLEVSNNSIGIFMVPKAGPGAYNNLVSNADNLIYFSNNTQNFGNLVIGNWSNRASGYGVKLTGGSYDVAVVSNTFTMNANNIINGNTTFNTSTYAINPTFIAYKEAVVANTVSTAASTIDLSTSNIFNLSMTLNTTVTFTNPPASGTAYSFMLYCKQDAVGSRTITWPVSVKWPNSSPPTMSTGANKIDVFNFFTLDGGTTYLGALSLANTG